jgi:Peptidase A4 family
MCALSLTRSTSLTRFARVAASLLLTLSLVGTAQAQTPTAESAVQDVVSRGNAAQAQALATRDSTILADTAADAYYQQLVRTNQGLLDSGVSTIELVDNQWGPISVGGATATVTTYETWRTSYSDGPTDYSRDRNVYGLVRDVAGTWKVASDDHPDGRNRRTTPQAPANPSPPTQAVEPGASTSRNWSGYAARGGSFTSVSATWTVPQLALDGPFGADATWVGIGGLRSHDLIQAGTQQSASGASGTSYQAWIEMLPDESHPVPLTVLPGDSVTVSVDQQAGDTWLISFANLTSGQSLQRSMQYTSSVSSAEWIEEAPFARRRVLPISQFGTLSFTSASAVKDGQSLTPADLGARAISLVDDAGRALAIPSPLSPDGASFSVSRI